MLKIEKLHRQGEKYYSQVFVKECKITKGNLPAKSFLDGSETCPSSEDQSSYELS